MSTQATYDDANLILRLYELRREEKLRKAREWMATFNASSVEELMQKCPPGSQENAYFRMVFGYWDMACSFVTSGVLNEELFFQSGGEYLVVWEKIRGLLPQMRAMFKNPTAARNLETVATRHIEWLSRQAPEAYAAMQERVKQMAAKQ
jgi:hypothetical protein